MSRGSWKLSRTVLRGGTGGNVGPPLDKPTGKHKTPFHFHLKGESPFGFAGLWERWVQGEDAIESYTLITTSPNELVGPVHDRMPVMLHPDDYDRWLDPKAKPLDLAALLVPFPAGMMTSHAVGSLVGSPKNDRPECIEPV